MVTERQFRNALPWKMVYMYVDDLVVIAESDDRLIRELN